MKHNNIFRNTLMGLSILAAFCVVFTLSACSDDDDDDNDDTTSSDTTSSDTTSSDTTSSDTTYVNAYAAVDLGLSVKWATCNIGAETPEDYGDYFAWGETDTKDSYTASNSVTYGVDMDDFSGNAEYDAATAHWGGTWRMPTEEECEELCDDCTWEWTTQNDVNGYLVTGSNGNFIFLPAAGYCDGTSLNLAGSYGYYWSSTPDSSYAHDAYELHFGLFSYYTGSSYYNVVSFDRYCGQSVRPVSE